MLYITFISWLQSSLICLEIELKFDGTVIYAVAFKTYHLENYQNFV